MSPPKPLAEAFGTLPREVAWNAVSRGWHAPKRGPPQGPHPSRTGISHATDSIAPTEFPSAPATTETFGPKGRQIPSLGRPERRRRAARHTVSRADTSRRFPQDLMQTVAEPAIHRPSNGARRRKTTGLQFPIQTAARVEARFNIWGGPHRSDE